MPTDDRKYDIQKRVFEGTTQDSLITLIASDGEIGIGTKGLLYKNNEWGMEGYTVTYLRPHEALELAADLIMRVHKMAISD